VAVAAVISLVWAHPVKPIEILLDCLKEVVAGDDGVRHFANLRTGVGVDVDVGGLCLLHRHVVAILAFLALLAHTGLEVRAQSRLVVNR
jgi:hypothetical protein